ncbi:hypothetical protein ACFLQN_00600 [Candidatus Aenigmatarchaeota archaeon]
MDQNTYNFSVGIVMIIVALIFYASPGILNYDAFIPIMLAIVSFIIGIAFFFMGLSEKKKR